MLKVLKAKDVQYGYGGLSICIADDVVHSLYQPGEETGVQGLGEGIPAGVVQQKNKEGEKWSCRNCIYLE